MERRKQAPQNYSFKGILSEEGSPPAISEVRLGELIGLASTINPGGNMEAGLAFPLLTGGGL